jgi:hypothetical protein
MGLTIQEPMTSGAGANMKMQVEKIAWSAPDTIQYAIAHTIVPGILHAPIQAKAVAAQASVAATTELKMPRPESASTRAYDLKKAPSFNVTAV